MMKNIILIPVLALVLFSVQATAQNKNLETPKPHTEIDDGLSKIYTRRLQVKG